MKDFTLDMYKILIERLKKAGYSFQRLEDYAQAPLERVVILRHDIDIWNQKALVFAKPENELDVKASYYFRYLKNGFDPDVIKEVVSLGHEVGYHYEDLTANDGDMKKAISSFEEKLNELQEYYPVQTICMHGRSGSPYDNRDLWKEFNNRDFGVIAEPYLDLDFDKVLYLSDTGRRWNGSDVAVRDRVKSKFDFSFTSTFDILDHIDELPDQIMFTIHPELWSRNVMERFCINFFVFVHTNYKKYYRNKKVRRKM